jgi:Uri superfamily endonuclease
MKGSYVLLIEMSEDKTIRIGKKGQILFSAGWYVYVGSAMNSIEKRVKRHFSKEKKHHWHIDYFLDEAKLINAFYKESTVREECIIAGLFAAECQPIPGFGSSDCSCDSHLFYANKKKLEWLIKNMGMKILDAK